MLGALRSSDATRPLKGPPSAADAPGMDRDDEPIPVGAIFDTNSKGRFDLVIYGDGLLAVKGTYLGVALRGAGAGIGGSGAGIGAASGSSYERNRLAEKLRAGRREVLTDPPTFFVPRESISDLALLKRWHGHSLIVRTNEDPGRPQVRLETRAEQLRNG
jgi:hypothetical protein